ncbi:sulfate/molybdate ABC transporter ATP-binding protein [Homoserinibacter sp. GY 40078]|uniref:sulfate/molybdate ABC transporter ATP-binding protein n=1 Tax=Homoserinibacter sp. GY 40078 TaxID=2603275 RepID=UPI0011C8954E|nr:ATP-binding cassette domain-containing protein [Homoserinibacter sp. GY 40078]TXK18574.1 ATP-binding cassette domain-containing protein [Homoserinibacter sp. GY 40078]
MNGLEARLTLERPGFRLELAVEVARGETVALLGPNGAGKSTAIAVLSGLLAPTPGRVVLGGRVLDDTAARVHVDPARRRVGVVFQDLQLFPHLSVRDNVAFAAWVGSRSRRRGRMRAQEWIERFSLEALADARPRELSGGQAQRVALARALASEPDALLLDEPMSALDVEARADARAELAEHLRGFDGPTVLVTHDLADAEALAGRALVLEGGRVTQAATLAELRAAPATPYVARLVGAGA